MTDDFYTAFEAVFRGPRSLIKERLAVYIPLVQALKRMAVTAPALDLGCGRGEWLELLKAHDLPAVGVDLDPVMLSKAQETGQTLVQDDALAYLESRPDESFGLVSAFHLVEHLPFDRVKALVSHAFRVLVPGGILLMETPNPENMMVAATEFYLDPTHQRPVPPKLLAFLPRYFGFERSTILRLNARPLSDPNEFVTLGQVLDGPAPDYAVAAQKQADPARMAMADRVFDTPGGHSLSDLVALYDGDRHQRRKLENALIFQARETADHARARAEAAERQVFGLKEASDTAKAELDAVYNSLSWRITAPLRAIKKKLFRRPGPSSSPPRDASSSSLPPAAGRIYDELTRKVENRERNSD